NLEVPLQFPIGNRLAELALLPFAGGGVMLDEIVDEQLTRRTRLPQPRCDFSEPGMTRSAQVRFSTPQVASVGAQNPGISREYEFTVLAIIDSSSGISACWPPMNQRCLSEMLCSFFGSWN